VFAAHDGHSFAKRNQSIVGHFAQVFPQPLNLVALEVDGHETVNELAVSSGYSPMPIHSVYLSIVGFPSSEVDIARI